MYMPHLKIRAHGAPWMGDKIAFHGFEEIPGSSKIARVNPLTLTRIDEKFDEGIPHDPMCYLSRSAAIELMDSLWNCGVRPSNGEGNVGQIGAMKDHLNDMRRLVFKEKGESK